MHNSLITESKPAKMQPRMRSSTTVARPVAPPASEKSERGPEKPVEFRADFPEAKEVALAGSFNNWDPIRNQMQKDATGWKTTVWLPPGRYEYKFVVDGQWRDDPKARECALNPFGGTNCVVRL
jgi:1,4-alpha-glucan branching enzyme